MLALDKGCGRETAFVNPGCVCVSCALQPLSLWFVNLSYVLAHITVREL